MKRDRKVTWIVRSVFVAAWVGGVLAATAFGAPPVQVNEAIPSTGEQGTTNLAVTIKGKGFDQSSIARFFVTGTINPGGVTVNSTAFQDSKTLLADITIDDAAEIANFDIEVELLSSGRKGKGTEKFQVTEKGGGGINTQVDLCGTFRDYGPLGEPDGIRSDGGTYCHEDPSDPDLKVVIGATNGRLNLWTDGTSRQAILDFRVPDFPEDCSDFIADPDCLTVVNFSTQNEWLDNGMGGVDPGGPILDLRTINPGETRRVDFQANFPSESKSSSHRVIWGGSNRQVCGNPVYITGLDTDFDGETDTWEVEATAAEQACFVEIVKKGNREIYHPGGALPFKLTLVKQ